eukprot:3862862-Prorocentrum_lima.AAC.1
MKVGTRARWPSSAYSRPVSSFRHRRIPCAGPRTHRPLLRAALLLRSALQWAPAVRSAPRW